MKTFQPKDSFSSVSKAIRQLILDTGLPLNRAPEALGMTSSEFMRWWSSPENAAVTGSNLTNAAKFLGIAEEQIILGKYDINLVRSRIFNDPLTLPEQYSLNRYSFLRTSAHIFRYLVLTRGQHFADSISRQLNVSPIMYQNLNNRISLNYFLDLLELLEAQGFNQNDLDTLAGVLFLGLAESDLIREFKKSKSYFECYSVLASNFNMFDENFTYTSDLDGQQFHLTTFLPYDNHNHFKWSSSQLNKLLRYRQILLGWFPYLCGLPPILPKVTHRNRSDGIESIFVVTFSERTFTPVFVS